MDKAGLSQPDRDEGPHTWRDFLPAAILTVIGGGLLIGLTFMQFSVPGQYLVLGSRSKAAADIVLESGGGVVSVTNWANLAVATQTTPTGLRAHGAWLVLPAPPLGCVTPGPI